MRRFLTALIALIAVAWCSRSEATNYGCELFLYSHVNFKYCSNYCRRSDVKMLYYSGLMEALNAHIDRRLQEGALQAKKFEIIFSDPFADMPAPVVEITQNRKGYHITSRDAGDLNLRHLVRVADYFTSRNWKPFSCCDRYIKVTPADIRRRFGRILDREVGDPNVSFFDGRRSIVLELDDLQLVYENDRLFFLLAGKRLDLEPEDPVPVKVGNRYLFGSKDFFHVFEKDLELRRRPKAKLWSEWECSEPFRAKGYRKWVNLGCGEGGARLSYSYDENRLYEVAAPEKYYQPRCGDEPDYYGVHPNPLRVIRDTGSGVR